MKKELIIKTKDQVVLDAIKNTGKTWFEMPLADHPIYPQFSRKLVVTGFNTADMEGDEERIYVNVRQYLILKENNTIHKKYIMPDWMIHEGNVEEIMGEDGNLLTGMLTEYDDDGNIISETPEVLKAQSVQYVRFLIKSKEAHIVDILTRFMGLYAEKFSTEIDAV